MTSSFLIDKDSLLILPSLEVKGQRQLQNSTSVYSLTESEGHFRFICQCSNCTDVSCKLASNIHSEKYFLWFLATLSPFPLVFIGYIVDRMWGKPCCSIWILSPVYHQHTDMEGMELKVMIKGKFVWPVLCMFKEIHWCIHFCTTDLY